MTGQLLGHYRLLEVIGSGGMGVVYRARDERLERDVALKVLPAGMLPDETARRRFRKEALALSKLNHPNIATVHDFNSQEDIDFLVMEYIPGVTLAEKIAGMPLPEKETVRLAIQLAQGLSAAHAAGVVHHDLKPGNLRVTPDDRLKILDFGLAQLIHPASTTAQTESLSDWSDKGGVGGTLPYMSPEQVRGARTDARTDIYSAGMVLYEMATGLRPFLQVQGPQLLAAILEQTPPPPSTLARRVSQGMENIILKALDKDADRRYQSAREMVVDLERLGVSGPVTAPPARHPRKTRRWAWRLPVAALGALLAVAAASLPPIRQPLLRWLGVIPIPEQKNVVVLPFEVTAGSSEDRAYADGLAEILTARLVRLTTTHRLVVVPTSEAWAHHVRSADQARKELGVTLVLEGTVRRSGDNLRIVCSLVDANSLAQLRVDRVTASVSESSAARDRLVESAVRMLALEPKPGSGTQAAGAKESYLHGRAYLQYYYNLENIDNAITAFEEAVKLDPNYVVAYAGLGDAYWKKYDRTKDGKWVEAAQKNCLLALALDPKLASGHVCRGNVYNVTGQREKAAVEFQSALEQEPANDDAYRGLAFAQEHLGNMREAEDTYRRAIELRPYYWAGYSWLGRFFFGQKRYKEAVAQFERVVALTPDNGWAYKNLGGVYGEMERYDDAIVALRKSIQLGPTMQAFYNLGSVYILRRQFEEAAAIYEQAIKLDSLDYRPWGYLGQAYYWTPGKRERAQETFERAVRLGQERLRINPRDADAQILLAQFCAMLRRKKEAFDHLSQALSLAPDNPEFLAIAAVVHDQFGSRSAALTWVGKAVAKGYTKSHLDAYPELDNLRDDPKFQALIRPK